MGPADYVRVQGRKFLHRHVRSPRPERRLLRRFRVCGVPANCRRKPHGDVREGSRRDGHGREPNSHIPWRRALRARRARSFRDRPATKARVEDADIERARNGFGVGGNEIVADVALAETQTVQRHAMFGQGEGFAFARGKTFTPSGSGRRFVIWLSASWLP